MAREGAQEKLRSIKRNKKGKIIIGIPNFDILNNEQYTKMFQFTPLENRKSTEPDFNDEIIKMLN
jgi:hypothetical protein